MRALTVQPGAAHSACIEEVPPPEGSSVLARTIAVGVCGTDREIFEGRYGDPPPGRDRLVLGHESIAQVEAVPTGSGLAPGDLVTGIVRRPDPVPCPQCAAGDWDMCSNGRYKERGIKALDGFCSDLFRSEPEFLVRVPPSLGVLGVLLEPASVVAKAWEHVERIGGRAAWAPQTLLVTGAGPVGLLAALMGVQRRMDLHVLDRAEAGPKPRLVRALGGTYHCGGLPPEFAPDIVMECTGAPPVIMDVIRRSAPSGVVCLAGISSGQYRLDINVSLLNRRMVLENDVVFGSVNANRRHYQQAAAVLAAADPAWLAALISRRVPVSHWAEAFERRPDDVKVILDFAA